MKGRILHVGLMTAAALLLTVTGCATDEDRSPLAGTEWVLEEYGKPGNMTPALQDHTPTLSFDDDSEVTGFTGCNWYGGTYMATADGAIEFGQMHQTTIACPEPGVMEQEADFMQILRLAQDYERADARLHISGDGHVLVFTES